MQLIALGCMDKLKYLKTQTKRILMSILPGLQAGIDAEIKKCFTILTPGLVLFTRY